MSDMSRTKQLLVAVAVEVAAAICLLASLFLLATLPFRDSPEPNQMALGLRALRVTPTLLGLSTGALVLGGLGTIGGRWLRLSWISVVLLLIWLLVVLIYGPLV